MYLKSIKIFVSSVLNVYELWTLTVKSKVNTTQTLTSQVKEKCNQLTKFKNLKKTFKL